MHGRPAVDNCITRFLAQNHLNCVQLRCLLKAIKDDEGVVVVVQLLLLWLLLQLQLRYAYVRILGELVVIVFGG